MKRLIIAWLIFVPLMTMAQRYVGGDISLLPTYEEHGVRYLDQQGNLVNDVVAYLGEAPRWNAMRVRLFVDPSKASATHQREGVRQDLAYVTRLCQRIKRAGYALMLDFHYSDTWTDPGQHSTPASWASSDPKVLADSVYRYTLRCLRHLKANGAAPDFIQPGNEITNGMMWPTGHCLADGRAYGGGTFANLVSYLQSGVKACREICPQAKIVLHTEMSNDAWGVLNFYNTLGTQVDYDIIGLSYYPDWHGPMTTLNTTLTTLERQHTDKHIMIVETGYASHWQLGGAKYPAAWPLSEAGQKQFVTDLTTLLRRHPQVTGLFWWMPEDNEYWADDNPAREGWWNASLYTQNTGRPLAAMFELSRFLDHDVTGISAITTDQASGPSPARPHAFYPEGYTLLGQRISHSGQMSRGIYIIGGRKVVIGHQR